MKQRVLLAVALAVPTGAHAYWGDSHQELNGQVFRDGKPFGVGVKRGSRDIKTMRDYLERVLLVQTDEQVPAPTSEATACERKNSSEATKYPLKGVPFLKSAVLPGLDRPTDAPSTSMSAYCWLYAGGLWEDGFLEMKEATKWGGRRAVNHIHDPLSPLGGGYTGLADENVATGLPFIDLFRRGISATEWVLNGQSGGPTGKNEWGYPTIGESLHRLFTEREQARREAGLATALRAMGQVMHLVSDNTVPDHARDLPHPGDGWEEYLRKRRPEQFGQFRGSWVEFPAKVVEQQGLRAFWDRDNYAGQPEATLAGFTPGVTEYVNANFVAWNRFRKGFLNDVGGVDFTTIPAEVGQPFKRTWTVAPSAQTLLRPRFNLAEYPWPRLAEPVGDVHPSAPRTLPLSALAAVDVAKGGKWLNSQCWATYVEPLMARAHGYAQSVASLALQPARAELIAGLDGDPLRVAVRLWNLWPTGGPHAVTWHVKEVRIVGARPGTDTVPIIYDDAPIVFPVSLDVAPGGHIETDERVITWAQRAALLNNSHAAVLVKGHLGNDVRTPVSFAVPIPNAYPLVQQLDGRDATPPYTNNVGGCCTSTCTECGENAVYRNPISQRVRGRITLAPAEVDVLGRPGEAALVAAQAEDARVAAVALIAFPRNTGLNEPVFPMRSRLDLTGGPLHLQRRSPGLWLRPADAPDEADGPIDFDVTLDVSEFYYPDDGVPVADGARASGTIYVAVWTTAGAVLLERLMLWPLREPTSAQDVIAPVSCQVMRVPQAGRLFEDRGSCSATGSIGGGGTCTNWVFHRRRTQAIWGDAAHISVRGATDPIDIARAFMYPEVRPTSISGNAVTLTGAKQFPTGCTALEALQLYPDGNGSAVCETVGPIGLALFIAENSRGAGQCQGNPQPIGTVPRVDYRRFYFDSKDLLTRTLGLKNLPAEWTFALE